MAEINVAIVVGSNRRESINRKLALGLAKLAEGKLAARIVQIDDLPIYNQDLENPLPASVQRLKGEIDRADAVLFVTPEHNRSIPAVLKNAIDWAARPYGQSSWTAKLVAIAGASPGGTGTALAQQHLRQILGSFLGAHVMGGEVYITFKPGLIDDSGQIADESTRQFLQAFIDRFATLAIQHSGAGTINRAA
jgi:chromate reductase, NAD(P)H dehydrogenase (quinone)